MRVNSVNDITKEYSSAFVKIAKRYKLNELEFMHIFAVNLERGSISIIGGELKCRGSRIYDAGYAYNLKVTKESVKKAYLTEHDMDVIKSVIKSNNGTRAWLFETLISAFDRKKITITENNIFVERHEIRNGRLI